MEATTVPRVTRAYIVIDHGLELGQLGLDALVNLDLLGEALLEFTQLAEQLLVRLDERAQSLLDSENLSLQALDLALVHLLLVLLLLHHTANAHRCLAEQAKPRQTKAASRVRTPDLPPSSG